MRAELKQALEGLAKAHDDYSAALTSMNEARDPGSTADFLGVSVEVGRAKDMIAVAAYLVDKAYRPKFYAKLEAWKNA